MAIKPPTFNLRDIERRRAKLLAVLQGFVGRPIQLDGLVTEIRRELPPAITYDTVFESVRYAAGMLLTDAEADELSWRLAGNVPSLQSRRPVTPWSAQLYDEWVPLQVLAVLKTRNAKDRIGYDVKSRVLAGSPVTKTTVNFWSGRAARAVASQIGFSPPWGKYPLTDTRDLVGLRFLGYVEAGRSRDRPAIGDISCPASMIKWNRDNVLKLRFRIGERCPRNYSCRCARCAIGQDQCPAGTHPSTFELGSCSGCGAASAVFDPADTSSVCVPCSEKRRLRN